MDVNVMESIKQEYSERRRRAQGVAEEHREEVAAKIPELRNLERETVRLTRMLVGAKENAGDILDRIEQLIVKQKELLVGAGYSENYLLPPYECSLCNDSGYVGTEPCSCFLRKLRLKMLEHSGLGKLANNQSFENYSIEYYPNEVRSNAIFVLDTLKDFAENFSRDTSENFLLMGATGLGKTHLSTAVAKTVIDLGYDVVYTTIIRMFDDFEKKRFGGNGVEFSRLTDRYFNASLLIIDDLGTEMSTQFTLTSFYDLLNTRLNEGKSTIINTNLDVKSLETRYDKRIASRILGNFNPLVFRGNDVRTLKLKQ